MTLARLMASQWYSPLWPLDNRGIWKSVWLLLAVVVCTGVAWPERYHLKVMGGLPFTPQIR